VVELRRIKKIISTVGGAIGGVLVIVFLVLIIIIVVVIKYRLGMRSSLTLWVSKV
jgi:hypothetical protein